MTRGRDYDTGALCRISGANSNLESKAVLMNAHFDTAVGSPGASDCAQCVGEYVKNQVVMSFLPGSKPCSQRSLRYLQLSGQCDCKDSVTCASSMSPSLDLSERTTLKALSLRCSEGWSMFGSAEQVFFPTSYIHSA